MNLPKVTQQSGSSRQTQISWTLRPVPLAPVGCSLRRPLQTHVYSLWYLALVCHHAPSLWCALCCVALPC